MVEPTPPNNDASQHRGHHHPGPRGEEQDVERGGVEELISHAKGGNMNKNSTTTEFPFPGATDRDLDQLEVRVAYVVVPECSSLWFNPTLPLVLCDHGSRLRRSWA